MADFVIREWNLRPHPGDQAPVHVHHAGDEGFIVLEGRIAVQDSGARHVLEAGSATSSPQAPRTPSRRSTTGGRRCSA